jgi:hypothetical protein
MSLRSDQAKVSAGSLSLSSHLPYQTCSLHDAKKRYFLIETRNSTQVLPNPGPRQDKGILGGGVKALGPAIAVRRHLQAL